MIVIARIYGGLGNQIFQYAAARRLALAAGAKLELDGAWFAGRTDRTFDLGWFSVAYERADERDIRRLRGWKLGLADRIVRRVVAQGLPSPRTFFGESGYGFDARLLGVRGDVYLDGYFQSFKYFEDVAGTIRRDLRPRSGISPDAEALAHLIEADASAVSVHLRRGDYVNNAAAARTHGTCPMEYYRRAMEYIEHRVRGPRYFVFSDDPSWAREHLQLGDAVHVSESGTLNSREELVLMSKCRHHIIANSTFSWWGAWLDERPGSVVVAPRRWFVSSRRDTSDLLPENWVQL